MKPSREINKAEMEPKPNPGEESDLLPGKNRVHRNGTVSENTTNAENSPPDGGFRAYAVLVGSFLTNGLLFGLINSYGIVYPVLNEQLEKSGVAKEDAHVSLVGSLSLGMVFLMSPVSGVLTSLLGLRLTAVLGGIIAAAGLLLSSFLTHNVNALIFTCGITYGLGASFAYTPSLAILGHYFKKHLGIVNGIVTVGSSVFTVLMPEIMRPMLNNYGLAWLYRLLALFSLGIALCGLLFKPISVIPKPSAENATFKEQINNILSIEMWKIRNYKFWALSMPVALFGYYVPYVHFEQFLLDGKFSNVKRDLPIQCIGITSGLGRLFIGWLADKPYMDKILSQQISLYMIGTLTMILPFANAYWMVIVISLGMGVFDGAFISLIGPIAFELCGSKFAAQAIGCMLGLAALPVTIGPYVAEKMYAATPSYTLPFVLAGLSPLVGATLMFGMRLGSRGGRRPACANGHPPSADLEKHPVPLLIMNGHKNDTAAL